MNQFDVARFDVSREDIERYVTIGFDLAIKTLVKDNAITTEQADEYADYACTSITNRSVIARLSSFFTKTSTNTLTFKFLAIKLKHTNDE